MKKMSKYLLCALSVLGTMNLSALPSLAIGSIPAYGDIVISTEDRETNLREPSQPNTTEYEGDGYVDEQATRNEQDMDDEENDFDQAIVNDSDDGHELIRNETPSVDDSTPTYNNLDEQTMNSPVAFEDNAKGVFATGEIGNEKISDAQIDENHDVAEKRTEDSSNPTNNVENDVKPEQLDEALQDEVNQNDSLPKPPPVKPSEVRGLPANVNADDMKNLMSKKVVKSVVDYIPYVVAFAKAKEAYRYLEKERAFDLPHKAYRDLTLLPQYEEVKMFTTLLCDVFEVDTPSEEKMVSNYKAKLPNLVVANKYLNNILDDLYDCKKAQKNGTYELNLKDLNFVNRLLISATSNDSDDSSTLPDEGKNNRTVFSVNEDEKKVAKKKFGKKIGTTICDDKTKDGCAKTVLRKITNNEIKEEVFA